MADGKGNMKNDPFSTGYKNIVVPSYPLLLWIGVVSIHRVYPIYDNR